MRKFIALAALTVGIGSLALTEVPFAEAQVKKEVKKAVDAKKVETKKEDAKKEDAKEDMGIGTIEIYKAKDGYLNIAVFGSKIWENFCNGINDEERITLKARGVL